MGGKACCAPQVKQARAATTATRNAAYDFPPTVTARPAAGPTVRVSFLLPRAEPSAARAEPPQPRRTRVETRNSTQTANPANPSPHAGQA